MAAAARIPSDGERTRLMSTGMAGVASGPKWARTSIEARIASEGGIATAADVSLAMKSRKSGTALAALWPALRRVDATLTARKLVATPGSLRRRATSAITSG